MRHLPRKILRIILPAMTCSVLLPAVTAASEPLIRVIGDKPAKQVNEQGEAVSVQAPNAPRGTTFRIVGDKPDSPHKPPAEQASPSELPHPRSTITEIHIIGDKMPVPKKKPATKPLVAGDSDKAIKSRDDGQAAAAAKQAAQQQQKAQEGIARQKAEESRLAAEKTELERQAAIKAEAERLAAAKAEEARKAAEQAEQERVAKIKAEEERAAVAARQTEVERLVRQGSAQADRQLRPASAPDSTPPPTANINTLSPEQPVAQSQQRGGEGAPPPKPVVASGSEEKLVPEPSTIWELYLAAKANDPALGRMEARVEGSKADTDVIFSGLLPHVDSTFGVKKVSQSLSNYTPSDASYSYNAFNYNVTARMNLFNLPTFYSMAATEANVRVEQAGVSAARQNLIVKLVDSYFALLKAQTERQIASGEINRLIQVLEQSHAFLKAGTGDIIAVYEAQSRLDGAKADLSKSESNLRLAEQKLSTVVGKPVSTVVNYLPLQPAGPDPDDLGWWVATMEKQQPAIMQAREVLVMSSEQRKAIRAEYLPTLQASGGYDVNRGTAALPSAEVRQWFVGASLSLPLYSGGETTAKLRRATASEDERRHIYNETLDLQREAVKQAFYNLRYNISFVRALEQKRASADIQLAAVTKGRKIGTRNAIDVLNAEQAYSIALRDYKYALYDNIIKVVQLKSAAGILSEADLQDLPTASSNLDSRLRVIPPASFSR